jgi:hypothetical protein
MRQARGARCRTWPTVENGAVPGQAVVRNFRIEPRSTTVTLPLRSRSHALRDGSGAAVAPIVFEAEVPPAGDAVIHVVDGGTQLTTCYLH